MAYAALVAVALLALYFLISYVVYRRAFVPDKPAFLDDFAFTPFEFQADSEEAELVTADGISFGAWHFRQPGSPQTVIVSGGHKGQRTNSLGISAALWRKGFNVILYSYRGMPGSDRAPITFGIKEVLELQAVIAFARKRIPNARIGLIGYSMGAVVSLLGAAGEPGVEALVLDSPFSDLRDSHRRERKAGDQAAWRAVRVAGRTDAAPSKRIASLRLQPASRAQLAGATSALLHTRRR